MALGLKRFFIFLVVILVGLSLGLTAYYMLQNEEILSIKNTTVYINVGETMEVELVTDNIKGSTKYELVSNSDILVKQTDGRFLAMAGGTATVSLVSSNEKYNKLKCTVKIGDGEEGTPFVVRNYDDLSSIGTGAKGLDKYYVQTTDIDLAAVNPKQFTPIANNDSVGFAGTYDGQGYKLHNLTITEPTGAPGETGFPTTPVTVINAGLFSKIAPTGIVKNLNINTVNIKGAYQTAGAIAGINEGAIEMINVVGGSVESTAPAATTSVGGAVGQNMAKSSTTARISRVSTTVNVISLGLAGGIAGENYGSVVINTYSIGIINGNGASSEAGGIVGKNRYADGADAALYKANVINSYSTSTINGTGLLSGAIIGNNIDKSANADEVNRIYGNYYLSDGRIISGLGNAADPTGEFIVVKGVSAASMASSDTYKTYVYASGENAVSWNFVDVWNINSQVNSGYPTLRTDGNRVADSIWDPTSDYYHQIDTLAKLQTIKNNLNGNYEITGDIDLIGLDWEPIGTEAAPFTGNITVKVNPSTKTYYLIKNLKISNYYEYAGLFGVISETATITGLTIQGVNITAGANIGAVVGRSRGVLTNCSAYAGDTSNYDRIMTSYNGDVNIGSIVGRLDSGGSVTTSGTNGETSNFATLNLSGTAPAGKTWRAGGIVGLNNGSVRFAKYAGAITIQGDGNVRAGGVAGESNGRIASCIATNDITLAVNKETHAGGLVGYNGPYARALYSHSSGSITARTAGGLLGYNNGPYRSVSMEECYVKSGNVYGNLIGGLVGYHQRGDVVNCYTFVTLSGRTMGGLAGVIEGVSGDLGENLSTANVTNCFASVAFVHSAGSAYYETSSEIRRSWVHALVLIDYYPGDGNYRGKIGGYVTDCIINTKDTGNAIRQQTSYVFFGRQVDSPNDGLRNDGECRKLGTFIDRGFNASIWGSAGEDTYPILLNVVLK